MAELAFDCLCLSHGEFAVGVGAQRLTNATVLYWEFLDGSQLCRWRRQSSHMNERWSIAWAPNECTGVFANNYAYVDWGYSDIVVSDMDNDGRSVVA
jgi:hypothetical protein